MKFMAFIVSGVVLVAASWGMVEKPKPRYNVEREQRLEREAAWKRLCVHYHIHREEMANVDMDIMCFKFREMVP